MNALNCEMWCFLLIILTTVFGTIKMEDCGEEELHACSKPLNMLGETTELSLVTRKEELDKLCPDLHVALHCINSYTRRCMNMVERNHFNKLHDATSEVINELCEAGMYQDDFLRHTVCIRKVRANLKRCSNQYQEKLSRIVNESAEKNQGKQGRDENKDDQESIKSLCCAFTEYMACSDHVILRTCGDETAEFTRKFHTKLSRSIVQIHCRDFKMQPGECGTNSSVRLNLSYISLFLTASFSFIFIYKY